MKTVEGYICPEKVKIAFHLPEVDLSANYQPPPLTILHLTATTATVGVKCQMIWVGWRGLGTFFHGNSISQINLSINILKCQRYMTSVWPSRMSNN